jgi:hypothetical protein
MTAPLRPNKLLHLTQEIRVADKPQFQTRIVTDVGRAFYLNILKPKPNDQGIDKYTLQFVISKSSPGVTPIKAALAQAKRHYETKFNGGTLISEAGWSTMLGCLRDGDAELADGNLKDRDYAGCYFFNASASADQQPGLVDADLNEIVKASDVYSGMFVKIDVRFYPFKNQSRGVAAWLNHVQKVRDGAPKSGAGKAGDAFSRYEDNDPDDVVY